MLRYLSFSLLFLFFCSCGTLPDLENFRERPVQEIQMAENPYFRDFSKDYLYKATISIYGRDMGGILAIKRKNDTLWRAAFMSEFGSTLLDISFSKTASQLNYSIEKLDKKYIITTLVEDFRLLVLPQRKVQKIYENKDNTLLKTVEDKGYVFYYVDKDSQRLSKIVKTNRRKKKTSVYFSDFMENQPNTIQIAHHDLPLELVFHAIPQAHVD